MKNKNTRKKIAGEVFDSGGYGCLFSPPLKCKKNNRTKKNMISKLMPTSTADQEHNNNTKIKKVLSSIPNYKDYYIFSEISCYPKKLTNKDLKKFNKRCKTLTNKKFNKRTINSRINDLKILQFPYGGITLENYIIKNINIVKSFPYINNLLIVFLKNAIIPMNKKNVYHFDIKDSNILIAGNNLRLIDWGLSAVIPDKNIPSNLFRKPLQFNYPFTSILLDGEFLKELIKNMKIFGTDYDSLKEFIKNYYQDNIVNKFGQPASGHFSYLNDVFSNFINENIDTYDVVYNFCTKSIINHSKNDIFDFQKYFKNTFLKIVDIWGFLSIYMSFLLVQKIPDKIKIKIQKIFFKHLYNNYGTINIKDLINDLKQI